ncbi:hypothetical protein ABEX78_32325 [Priestia megaterium]
MNAGQVGQQLRGIRKITLSDGIEREAFYNALAVINLQKRYGSLQKVFGEFEKGLEMDFEVFVDFLFEGLKAKNKELTKEEVMEVVDFFDMENIIKGLFGGLTDALPQ